jgi:hypothetical protein
VVAGCSAVLKSELYRPKPTPNEAQKFGTIYFGLGAKLGTGHSYYGVDSLDKYYKERRTVLFGIKRF